jgi:hypothetical protein
MSGHDCQQNLAQTNVWMQRIWSQLMKLGFILFAATSVFCLPTLTAAFGGLLCRPQKRPESTPSTQGAQDVHEIHKIVHEITIESPNPSQMQSIIAPGVVLFLV